VGGREATEETIEAEETRLVCVPAADETSRGSMAREEMDGMGAEERTVLGTGETGIGTEDVGVLVTMAVHIQEPEQNIPPEQGYPSSHCSPGSNTPLPQRKKEDEEGGTGAEEIGADG